MKVLDKVVLDQEMVEVMIRDLVKPETGLLDEVVLMNPRTRQALIFQGTDRVLMTVRSVKEVIRSQIRTDPPKEAGEQKGGRNG